MRKSAYFVHLLSNGQNIMQNDTTQQARCVGYCRTSSATNVGSDKDSEARQRAAIQAYAERASLCVAEWFYDAAVSGADAIDARPGFARMLAWCAENDIHIIVVESTSRFARDLIVQEVGFTMLTKGGFKIIAADNPESFLADGPTATLIRQILGAVSQFEKAGIVSKLKGARERKSAALGAKCAGRGRSYAAGRPELIDAAKHLADGRSLRAIGGALAEMGYLSASARPFGPEQIKLLLSY
jgi:DNA invertase Pin-like site-specific DNA recombinase